ncbi:sigma 54-interacting transcriptional regulator [Enterococcus faecium]|uniref:sigma 54-interacting transcriptional regulator n=1 Tax=Enterococcus faecium TaxID=1352 RepID=UPI0039C5C64F
MKTSVLDVVEKLTRENLSEDSNADYIGNQLNIKRNTVSQYLNHFFHTGKLVKINTRPVLFFDRKTIEMKHNIEIKEKVFQNVEDLKKMFAGNHIEEKKKTRLIGEDGSLKDILNQCKATMIYPPNGLPVLLNGETGTGKSYLAKLLYDYAIESEVVEADTKFIQVNCSEYSNNPELLTGNLFGYKKGAFTGAIENNLGLLHYADNGVLFLDEVHCLPPECQEKLFVFMDRGVYHMLGDNETEFKSKARLIFATTENPSTALLPTLVRRIPVSVKLPSLKNRGANEKLELICAILKNEEKNLNKKITINNAVYKLLMSTDFIGNIGELRGIIQAFCVNANFDAPEEKHIKIDVQHMPTNFPASEVLPFNSNSKENFLSIDELSKFNVHSSRIFTFFENSSSHLLEYQQNRKSFSKTSENLLEELQSYLENFVVHQPMMVSPYKQYLKNSLNLIFEGLEHKFFLTMSNNEKNAICEWINDYNENAALLNKWSNVHADLINIFSEKVRETFRFESLVAENFIKNLLFSINVKLDTIFEILFILFIKKKMNKKYNLKRFGVVLCHGFSTASSMAEAANRLVGSYVFEGIDMPITTDVKEVNQQINTLLNEINNVEELFLLVDMGSLKAIYKELKTNKINVGIINNANTQLAIEIGFGIINQTPMEEILSQASSNAQYEYHVEYKNIKENVILCSCATGQATAEKIKQVILSSLPTDIPIKVKTYDYNSLFEKESINFIKKNYNLVCVIGTINPEIAEIPFVPIEELIVSEDSSEINKFLSMYLTEEALSAFNKELIKNFSLSNLISSLTILNPQKLLEEVTISIEKLQNQLNTTFSSKICFGLYVHVCLLIERLILGNNMEYYPNSDEFIEKHTNFIKCVKDSFSGVESSFSVEIPVEEIGYIFDYVKNDNN